MFGLSAKRAPAISCHAPCAVAVAEGLDAGAAETAAGVEGQAVFVAEVGEGIDHSRQDADFAVKVEVGRDQRRQARGARVGCYRRPFSAAFSAVRSLWSKSNSSMLGTLVAELSLYPEKSEVVTEDGVEVVAGLVIDSEGVAEGRVGGARGIPGGGTPPPGTVSLVVVEFTCRGRNHCPAGTSRRPRSPEVQRAVAGRRRSGDDRRGRGGCSSVFTHG